MIDDFSKFSLQLLVSFGGAYFAAYLATRKHKNEKLWERKMTAYTDLIEALHTMKWHIRRYIDAEVINKNLSEDEIYSAKEEINDARRKVWKIADGSIFLVPKEVMLYVKELDNEIQQAITTKHWFDRLDGQYAAIEKCLERVKKLGYEDLLVH